jgi:hypothetical protein
MPLPYAQNKKHILKWRETHRAEFMLLNRTYMKTYLRWKKIKMEFCRILIDDMVVIPI